LFTCCFFVAISAAPDAAPVLKNSIDHIKVLVGRYFELRIPSSTFEDQEDGNTRNLSLTITLVYGKPLPADGWLKFNEISQTLYGIPLKSDTIGQNVVNKFILTAKDSQGQVVKDAISLTYEYEMELNHRLSVKLNGSYEKFTGDRANLIQFARNVAGFYGDKNLDLLTFSNIEKGSVIVTWSNNSLLGMVCKKSVIP
jgi:neurexin